MTVKDACRIFGIDEDTSKDEISKRYDMMLKRYRFQEQSGEGEEGEKLDLQEISEAYNLLMGYDTSDIVDETPHHESVILKKMGVDEKKTRNFLYYYKYHIIFSIIGLLIITSIIKGCVTRIDPDLNLVFLGNIYYSNSESLGDKIKSSVPGVKAVSVDGAYMSPSAQGQDNGAMAMKRMVLLGAADSDIFIVDKDNFDLIVHQGGFISLDDLADELGIDRDKNKEYITDTDDTPGEEHLYAVDVSSAGLLGKPELLGEKKIVGISAKVKHKENALKLLKLLISQSSNTGK